MQADPLNRASADTPDLAEFLDQRGFQAVQMQASAVGHFELPVKINGHERSMLLDTGASMTVLDQQCALDLNLATEQSSEKGGGLGVADAAVSTCMIDTFSIDGSFQLERLTVFVMDLSHVNAALEQKGAQTADGVIGADILREHQAVIDYGSAVLYLRTPQSSDS